MWLALEWSFCFFRHFGLYVIRQVGGGDRVPVLPLLCSCFYPRQDFPASLLEPLAFFSLFLPR